MTTLADRFWAKVRETRTCWLWTASTDSKGYGKIGVAGKTVAAHRVAWFLTYGEWPTKDVLHHCDNPRCVRPSHLFLGTQLDNMRDMVSKGRHHSRRADSYGWMRDGTWLAAIRRNRRSYAGEGNPHARLTTADVVDIRTRQLTAQQVVEEYGMSSTQARRIVDGESWKNVAA